MSRIGKLPIEIPSGVSVEIQNRTVRVKGPKGELALDFLAVVDVRVEDGRIIIGRKNDAKSGRSAHGLTRTLIANMVTGVTKGFRKSLEIQGVGYRVAKVGERLNLTLGFSHPVSYDPPAGIAFVLEGTNKIHVDGIDNRWVGQVAAEIHELRPPDPYKGKGIRYEGEVVRRKLGKAGKGGKK